MTSIALPDAGRRRPHRSWRLLRVGVLNERAFRIRLIIAPMMMAVQLYLYDRLWTAVFQHTSKAAGLTLKQTLTYSLMALLMGRIRWNARTINVRDSIPIAVREGTIVYWFLRPISPGRFYMWRQSGDVLYGGAWALLGYAVLLAGGVIDPPHGATGAVVFAVSLALGQVVLYYLGQIVDVAMFWMLSNNGLARMYYFVQDLLSGVFVPLPFMPAVMLAFATWLPFSSGVNVPLSLYVGRIPLSHAPAQLALQLFWCAVLALVTRFMWQRASHRVTVQGG
ncbi:MAG TPA: ABC-2 family transporter protein [Acidothermaceae bacterium]|jgi:ABC-2 type transport system permease protein|nr:ABC-2 family transporter protein [Acidothermaceae bacterium]